MATLTGVQFETEVLAPIYSNSDDVTQLSSFLSNYTASTNIVTPVPDSDPFVPVQFQGYLTGSGAAQDGLVVGQKSYTVKPLVDNGQTSIITDGVLANATDFTKAKTLTGSNDDNVLGGNDGNNTITAKKGNDNIVAGGGNDTVTGDAGDDIIYAGDGKDKINGNDGVDEIHGGSQRDTLKGDNGNDTIFGDNGNDNINGGNDNDEITGGQGNDLLAGGNGDDVFMFANTDGADVIKDFKAGDTLVIDTVGGISTADFEAGDAAEGPAGVLLNFNDGGSVLLKNVKLADLVFDDAQDSFSVVKNGGNLDNASDS